MRHPGEYVVSGCYHDGVRWGWNLYLDRGDPRNTLDLYVIPVEDGLWETQYGDTVELAPEPVVEPEEQGELGL
jgi:hypothetical protein